MIPTPAQLSKLRSQPHATKLYLSVYQPSTILACRVNDLAIVKGAREITFDGVTAGSYSLVKNGMSMRVGTVLGGADKGFVRVRSATSTVITVAENSHINWADNDYLTIENFYEINPIYPRIIQDPSNPEQTLWYKDYDIVYTNQNSVLGSFICMGSHYAGFLDDQVYYTASGTFNFLGNSLSYFWFFEGGTPTGSTSHTPGYITYNTPGHYTTHLIVSGTATADVSYRHISIYNRPSSGTSVPILSWELMDMSGQREQGGYTASIRIHQTIPESQLRDGSLVVIFAEDWYGDLVTRQSIGGNALNRASIFFIGYVLNGTIRYNYRNSYVDFDVGSPTEIMKLAEGFSVSIQDSTDPSTATSDPNIPSAWVTVLNMDAKRAIYHYLRWHSTTMLCNDIQFIGTDRALQYFDADRTSMFDAVNTLMSGAMIGRICCDRQGKIWLERDIYIEPNLFQTSFTIDDRDWMDEPSIDEQHMDKISYVEVGGVAYSGSTGTYTALLSSAPGNSPGYRGTVLRNQGLSLISQAELNTISGAIWAQKNAKYPSIEIPLSGNYRNFDIAPQENTPLTLTASDTARGISFVSKNFYVQGLRYTYDPVIEFLRSSLNISEITSGFSGDTIIIPETIEEQGFNQPGIVFPKITIPPFPTINIGIGGGTGDRPNFVMAVPQPGITTLAWADAVTTAAMGFCYCEVESTLVVTPIMRETFAAANTGEIAVTFTIYVISTCDTVAQSVGGSTNPYLYTMRTKGSGDQRVLCLTNVISVGSNIPANSIIMIFGQRTGSNANDDYLSDVWMCGWHLEWTDA